MGLRRPLLGREAGDNGRSDKRFILASVAAFMTLTAVGIVSVAVNHTDRRVTLFQLPSTSSVGMELHRMSDLVENEVDGVKAKARAVPGIAHIQSYRMSDEVKNTAQKAQSFVSAASTAPVLKTRKTSRLEHLASANAAFSEHHGSELAAPAPGIYIAPMDTDGMPQCDIWHLEVLYDEAQIQWTGCMANPDYKEPNSIAQEIFDELDAKEDTEVTPKEYCEVAHKHSARLTTDQCKEIVRLMDEAAGDADGVLTFAEFKTAFLKGQEPPAEEEEEEAAERRRRRRHLLSWEWVPGKGVDPEAPFDTSALATLKRHGVSMKQCKDMALGDLCKTIGKCQQPVCNENTMYNNSKVEALCGMCTLAGQEDAATASMGKVDNDEGSGCFAMDASVQVQGKGPQPVALVASGDRILAAAADGSPQYSRVIFTHEHLLPSATVKLSLGGDVMELTPAHQVPVYTEECGPSYCAGSKLVKAKHVSQGDKLYFSDGSGFTARTVTAVSKGEAKVKYIVTEAGNLLVNGVLASVYSTMARQLETLPFFALDYLLPGVFQWAPIKAALQAVLESPALSHAEKVVDALNCHSYGLNRVPSSKLIGSLKTLGAPASI